MSPGEFYGWGGKRRRRRRNERKLYLFTDPSRKASAKQSVADPFVDLVKRKVWLQPAWRRFGPANPACVNIRTRSLFGVLRMGLTQSSIILPTNLLQKNEGRIRSKGGSGGLGFSPPLLNRCVYASIALFTPQGLRQVRTLHIK